MHLRSNKTILVVEDEEAIRAVLRDVLTKNDFSVLEAKDGREGINQAFSKHPDLILLDLLMPKMNGMEALKKIRHDTWGAHVPVIILTNLSADNEELVQDMVTGRPVCYLIKSDWKMEDIVAKVQDVLVE